MEFLSEEWFAATNHTAGGCRALEKYRQHNIDSQIQNLRDWQINNRGVTTQLQWEYYDSHPLDLEERNAKIKQWSQEFCSNPENLKRRGESIRRAKQRRFRCLITGYEGNGSAVSQHQIKQGIDHKNPANRVQIK
jgi:hypothetical protein